MSAKDVYLDGLEHKLELGKRWHATWLPDASVRVGMIGQPTDRQFNRTADLTTRGIQAGISTEDGGSSIAYSTSDSVDFLVGVQGKSNVNFSGLADGEAGVKVAFHRGDAVAVSFVGLSTEQVDDEKQLAEAMVDAYGDNRLETGDCVVSRVLSAKSGFALVAADAGAEVSLKASANLGSGSVDVGSLNAAMDLKHQSKMSLAVTMPNGARPAYRMLMLDERGVFVRRPIVVAAAVATEPEYLAVVGEDS
jgi:hypothetical protein